MPKLCQTRDPDLPLWHTAMNPLVSTTQAQALCQRLPAEEERRLWERDVRFVVCIATKCRADSATVEQSARQERRRNELASNFKSQLAGILQPDCCGTLPPEPHRRYRRQVNRDPSPTPWSQWWDDQEPSSAAFAAVLAAAGEADLPPPHGAAASTEPGAPRAAVRSPCPPAPSPDVMAVTIADLPTSLDSGRTPRAHRVTFSQEVMERPGTQLSSHSPCAKRRVALLRSERLARADVESPSPKVAAARAQRLFHGGVKGSSEPLRIAYVPRRWCEGDRGAGAPPGVVLMGGGPVAISKMRRRLTAAGSGPSTPMARPLCGAGSPPPRGVMGIGAAASAPAAAAEGCKLTVAGIAPWFSRPTTSGRPGGISAWSEDDGATPTSTP